MDRPSRSQRKQKVSWLDRTILPAMRVVRIVALLIATVAATLHGAVDHAPSAIFQKRKRYRNAQAAQQSKAHIRPIAGSLPGFCQ